MVSPVVPAHPLGGREVRNPFHMCDEQILEEIYSYSTHVYGETKLDVDSLSTLAGNIIDHSTHIVDNVVQVYICTYIYCMHLLLLFIFIFYTFEFWHFVNLCLSVILVYNLFTGKSWKSGANRYCDSPCDLHFTFVYFEADYFGGHYSLPNI